MKIAVIGCGAMGSFCAAKLSKSNDVICLDAFLSKVKDINESGITVEENAVETNYHNMKAYLNGEYHETVDMVLLFVKSTQNISALESNKDIIGDKTLVLSLQNGYGNDRDIKRYVDPSRIILGNTLINCVRKDKVIKRQGNGITRVGSVSGDKKNTLKCKTTLEKAGFECEICEDVKRMVWTKLIENVTLNPLCAIFKCKVKVVFENKYIWEILERLVKEAIDVAKLDGVEFEYYEEISHLKQIIFNIGQGYVSMYQDVEQKRITEVERLNGAIVSLAYRHGYSAPCNEFILNTIKAIEKLY